MAEMGLFRKFRRCLGKQLAPAGFRASEEAFTYVLADAVIVIEPQYHVGETGALAINLGIALDLLREASGENGMLTVDRCHWRSRLGSQTAFGDGWWGMDDDTSAESLCTQMASRILNSVLPRLIQIAKPETLLELWRDGKSEGLTEFERRTNLALLLAKLGRSADAVEALHMLEKASFGRPWAAAAVSEVREIRKILEGRNSSSGKGSAQNGEICT
jgi:hypothetical protein